SWPWALHCLWSRRRRISPRPSTTQPTDPAAWVSVRGPSRDRAQCPAPVRVSFGVSVQLIDGSDDLRIVGLQAVPPADIAQWIVVYEHEHLVDVGNAGVCLADRFLDLLHQFAIGVEADQFGNLERAHRSH